MSERKRWEPYSSRDKYPCKGCAERIPGCHDGCERYQTAKQNAGERKAKENEKRIAECNAAEFVFKNRLKSQRKKMPQR